MSEKQGRYTNDHAEDKVITYLKELSALLNKSNSFAEFFLHVSKYIENHPDFSDSLFLALICQLSTKYLESVVTQTPQDSEYALQMVLTMTQMAARKNGYDFFMFDKKDAVVIHKVFKK